MTLEKAHNQSVAESQWGQLCSLTAIFLLTFLGRIVLAPLMPSIEKDLGIDHGEAGSLFFLISSGYFVGLLGSGFFSSRLTHRHTVSISACGTGLALILCGLTHSLWEMRTTLFLLGLAAGLYLPSAMATLTQLIHPRHWGKAIAIHEMAPNGSFVIAPLICEVFLLMVSWRGVLLTMGVCSCVLGICFAFRGRGGDCFGEPPGLEAIRELLREPALWIMIFLFGLGISGTLGVFTMLPLYLVTDHGIDRSWANTLVALSRIPGLGMAFLAGWATDRLGPRKTMAGVFVISGTMTVLLGLVSGTWVVVMVFIQPVVAACFFPPGFAALSRIGPTHRRNLVISLTVPAAFLLGGGAIPAGIGLLADIGSFSLGFALVGAMILSGLILSLCLRFTQETKGPG